LNYLISNLTQSPKEIVSEILAAGKSQLLIPPQYSKDEIKISELISDKKSIGLFSSGTTAHPKCIWNTFDNLILNAQRSAEIFEIDNNKKLLILAKPWHVAGLSWAIMAEKLGCKYEFITTNRGEDEKWLKVIKEFKPDYLLTVPPVLGALYNASWFVPNIVFGGIPFKYGDFEPLSSHCSNMYQGYGQTEAGGLIACHKLKSSDPIEKDEHLNCGTALKGVELKSDGTILNPANIFIKSETAFTNGWYDSGDLGYMKESEVHIIGRDKKVISKKH